MNKKILKTITTLGPIGYLPAPGTAGTLVGLLLVYFFNELTSSHFAYASAILVIAFVAYYSISAVNAVHSDPSETVIDEVVGTFLVFWNMPKTPEIFVIGFVLFRFFDIVKPFGIKEIEKLPGAKGVILDDVAAGLSSNLILEICIYLQLIT